MGTVRHELTRARDMLEIALRSQKSKEHVRLHIRLGHIYVQRALRQLEKDQERRLAKAIQVLRVCAKQAEKERESGKALGKERAATNSPKLMLAKAGRKVEKPVRQSSLRNNEKPLRGKPLKRGGAKTGKDASICRKFEPSRRDRNYCAHCGAHKNAPHAKPKKRKSTFNQRMFDQMYHPDWNVK